MTHEEKIEQVLFGTLDPEVTDGLGRPFPALTTLLHRVCGSDQKRFEEACRVVELFIGAALLRDQK